MFCFENRFISMCGRALRRTRAVQGTEACRVRRASASACVWTRAALCTRWPSTSNAARQERRPHAAAHWAAAPGVWAPPLGAPFRRSRRAATLCSACSNSIPARWCTCSTHSTDTWAPSFNRVCFHVQCLHLDHLINMFRVPRAMIVRRPKIQQRFAEFRSLCV